MQKITTKYMLGKFSKLFYEETQNVKNWSTPLWNGNSMAASLA